MKIKIIIFFALLGIPALVSAQESKSSDTGLLSGNYSFLDASPDFGVQMSSSFTSGFAGAGMFSQSIAPHMQFRPGKNFSIIAGSILSTSSFSGGTSFMAGPSAPTRFYSTTVYALGAYQVNQRLTVSGGAWGERNNLNELHFSPQMNPQAFNMNAGGIMMGLDYKITENLRFGAEINVSRGSDPFNPYMNNNPFNPYNSFNRRRTW